MKRKRIWIGVIGVVLVVVGVSCSFFGKTGGRRFDVCLLDFSQTEDTVTIQVSVASSAGYVRTCELRRPSSGDLILSFYSTYGINSRWGAEDTFTIETPETCGAILFERADGTPDIVLARDKETGVWRGLGGS